MIIAEYSTPECRNWRKAVIDPDSGTATFYRCHHPNRFFQYHVNDEYTCRLDEIRGTCWRPIFLANHVLRWYYDVVTLAGRVMFPLAAAGFREMRVAIQTGLRPGARLRWYQIYWVQLALYGLVGITTALVAIPVLVQLPKNAVQLTLTAFILLWTALFLILMRKEPTI